MPKTNIVVKLVGSDSNAFNILGKVCKALRTQGHANLVEKYKKEATSGNYEHLLQVTMDYVEVE